MPDAQQQPLTEAEARQFVLTTVWQGLSELADHINAQSDRIATLTVDPATELAKVTLLVYPVGSQPAQATPLFRYDVAVASASSGVSVQFLAQPAAVNGKVYSREDGELTIPSPGERRPLTPEDIRDDVTRRYQAVMAARTARDARR